MVSGGIKATATTIKTPAIKKGIKSLTTDSIEHLAMVQEMNRVVPTGGVNRPRAYAHRQIMAI